MARVREPEGFREYVAGSRDRLLRAAWLLTGDLDEAEDLLQVALSKVWSRWRRITSQEGDIDAYVRRVLVTCHLTALRRRRWRELPYAAGERQSDVGQDPQDELVAEWDLLVRVLACLPPRQRLTVVLRYYLDASEGWFRVIVATLTVHDGM